MSQVVFVSAMVATVLCFLCGSGVLAQNLPMPVVSLNCSDVSSMPINGSLNGTWYEVVANPAPASPLSCVRTTLQVSAQQLTLKSFYSKTANSFYMNETESMSMTLASNNSYGVNYTMTMSGGQSMTTTYKIVDTDYKTYLIACGYTNSTDNSTSFGVILTQQQQVSATNLANYESMAQNMTMAFRNATSDYYIVPQTAKCTTNSATTLPIMSGIVAVLFALVKFLH